MIINLAFGSGADERYLHDYVLMTKKGLYSFDKTCLNNFFDSKYHLVTSPSVPLKIENLPQEIFDILIKTKYSENSLHKIAMIEANHIS